VDREQVDATVHAAMERYDVCELACDPFGWHAELARWADAYGQVVVEFPTNQRGRMGVAVSRFTSAVMTGGLAHDGDPRLARHIGHVVARETAEGVLLGKDSKASPRRIDAAIAGVIAHERAYWHATNSSSLEPLFVWT
jgi:phage terminase large subunit-like protein